MTEPISVAGAIASVTLVLLAAGLSWWRGVGVEKSVLWAAFRAAVQLLAVGAVLAVIFTSSGAMVFAWLWVVFMVVVAGETARRRAPKVPGLRTTVFLAIGGSAAVALAVVFGFQILELTPVTVVVTAGITIGNTMPSTVLASDLVVRYLQDNRLQIEGLLALGFGEKGASQFLVRTTARTALIPQIERTKVVGLIALPGAMTGLLLAGVEPIDAVIVQLVVMYLVLAAVVVAVLVVVTTIARRAFTPDLRLEPWTVRS